LPKSEVPQDLIGTAIDLELADGTVVADWVGETPCIFLAGLHRAERNIADNGDIGYIEDVDPDADELTAVFDGRPVSYGFGELDTLVPAYAATIHKSQGSENPAVVIPILTQHYPMLQRNLLYTGITRGKRLVVLVG
jgi:ATP-dependent exoDNAse (exonuclease V) alpha subunit